MLKLRGICVTNEINRYNHKFTEKAIIENYNEHWMQPFPSFANHNHTKAVGYTLYSGLYFEPQYMCMLNSMFVPETEQDEKNVKKFCYDYLYKERVLKNKKDYDYLKDKLTNYIQGEVFEFYTNGSFVYNKNIVTRVFPDLCGKIIDGLIDINLLQPLLPGIYKIGEFVIYAHKFFRRGYSYLNTLNTPFLERIEKLKGGPNKVQIAIDLDCIGLASVQKKEYEYSYWGGPIFDDKIENIKVGVTVFDNENYDGLLSEVKRTELGWYFQDNIKTFECEELVDLPNIKEGDEKYYGCRYVHSMVDKVTYKPVHLDGAVRVYDDDKMIHRLDIRMNKAKRDTRYTKIWRIDGEIKISIWKELISHYYRDNILIGEYFDGKDKVLLNEHQHINETEKSKGIKHFVPDDLTINSGIKCFISFSSYEPKKFTYDLRMIPTTSCQKDNIEYSTFESISITFNKMLEQKKLKVNVPSATIITYNDFVDNLPTYFCKDARTANEVVQSIKELVEIWALRDDDRLVTFSLKIPYTNKAMTISFAGHVKCFYKYFSSNRFTEIPEDETMLPNWLREFYDALGQLFKISKDVNPLSFVKKNNIIVIDRKSLEPENIGQIKYEKGRYYTELAMSNEDYNVMQRENIGVSFAVTDEKLKCSKCGNSYYTCKCILYKDQDVRLNVQNFKFLGLFWTNRKA